MKGHNQTIRATTLQTVAPFFPPVASCNDQPWEIKIYRAASNPTRWQRFNKRATACYAAMGLDSVAEVIGVDINQFDTYFAEATILSAQGRRVAVGGIKIHAADAQGNLPLFTELADHLNIKTLRSYLLSVCSPNLCHGGGLWIDRRFAKTGLAADLARACVPIILAMEATWCVAMTHTRILDAWASLGWHKIKRFPTFAYPDSRYESSLILGSVATWPPAVKRWASDQVQRSEPKIRAPDALLMVQPLRAEG